MEIGGRTRARVAVEQCFPFPLARETSLTMMVVTSTGLGEWSPGQASRTGDSSICVKLKHGEG